MNSVVNVAAFIDNAEIKNELVKAAEIRKQALDYCYAIEGYKDMPLEEKNYWYDLYIKQLQRLG